MKTIPLPQPQLLGNAVGPLLKNRRSVRNYADRGISDQELSTLLWFAAGISDKSGKRTAPSCLDLRTVTIAVLRADGAWRYNAELNRLELLAEKDLRALSTLGQHAFVDKAAVTLVFIMENSPRTQTARPNYVYVDAGAMVQNAYLACEAMGLGGVVRGSTDWHALGAAMNLPATEVPILCFTAGMKF